MSQRRRLAWGRVVLGLGAALIVTLPTALPGRAASSRELHDKLARERATLKRDKAHLQDIKGRYDHTLASLRVVKANLTYTQSKINIVGHEVLRVRAHERATRQKMVQTEKLLSADRHTVSGALQAFQVQGAGGYLNVLLSAQSIEDFIERVNLVGQLMRADDRVLTQISDEQKSLSALTRKLHAQATELTNLHTQTITDARQLSHQQGLLASDVETLVTEKSSAEKTVTQDEGNEQAIEDEIKALESQGGGQDVGSIAFAWPVHGPITSPFGMRFDPVYRRYQLHAGIDIGVPVGTPIRAAAAGKVIVASWISGWGYVVEVDHGDGVVTLYAHQSRLGSAVGEHVSQGEVIGYSGATGATTGPCLHFGLYLGGRPVNPLPYLPGA